MIANASSCLRMIANKPRELPNDKEPQSPMNISAGYELNQTNPNPAPTSDAANIAVDFNAGQNFALTLADNRTLDNPTNCVPGQVGSIFIVQDGTGSRTLAYGSSWDFPGGTAPVLSTDAAAVDRLDYIVQTSTDVQALVTKAYS